MKKTILIDFGEGEGLEREEYKGEVTLKRFNFEEQNAYSEESTDIKFFGATQQVKVSTSKLKELGILKSVIDNKLQKITYFQDKVTKALIPISNSYPLDLAGIRNLPREVGDMLFIAFSEINEVSEKKKES